MNFKYISGLAGAGKTHSIINQSIKLVSQQKFCAIVSPSLLLSNQIKNDIRSKNKYVPIVQINSDIMEGKSCAKEISTDICTNHEPHILLITHDSFLRNNFWANQSNWHIFIDEAMDLHRPGYLSFADPLSVGTREKFLDTLEQFVNLGPVCKGRRLLTPKSDKRIKRIIAQVINEQTNDDYYKILKEFFNYLAHPNFNVYVNEQHLLEFMGKQTPSIVFQYDCKLDTFDRFDHLVFSGARIEKSMMFDILKTSGHTFTAMNVNLRFDTHDQPISIKVGYDRFNWSKSYFTQKPDGNKTHLEIYQNAVIKDLNGNRCLTQSNLSKPWPSTMNNIQIPHRPEGINEFQHIDHYAQSGAYNFIPQYIQQRNYSHEVLLNRTVEHIYQGIQRTSLRTGKFNNNVVYVPTLEIAKQLQSLYYPNANIEFLEECKKYNKVARSGVERNSRCLIKKKFNNTVMELKERNVNSEDSPFYISMFLKNTDKIASEIVPVSNFEELMITHKELNTSVYRKDDVPLFMYAASTHQTRTKNSLDIFNPLAILDIDESEITPSEFKQIFPDTNLFIHSTFSHMKDKNGKVSHRYRVIMELDKTPQSPEEYTAIIKGINFKIQNCDVFPNTLMENVTKLNMGGDSRLSCALDGASENINQLYYGPSIAKENEDYIFFEYQKGNKLVVDDVLLNDIEAEYIDSIEFIASNAYGSVMACMNMMLPGQRFVISQKIGGLLMHNAFTSEELTDIWLRYQQIDPDHKRVRNIGKLIGNCNCI